MEASKRARTPVRRQVSKLVDELTTLCGETPANIVAIKAKLVVLDKVNVSLELLDAKIVDLLIESNDDAAVQDAEMTKIEEYQTRIATIQVIGTELISQRQNPVVFGNGSATQTAPRNYKLPKVELKKFNGSLKDWLGFWSQFKKIHEDVGLPDVDKFQYLVQAMEDGTEAKDMVNCYLQTPENYPLVVEALNERFGREDLLMQVYIRELLKLVIVNATNKEQVPLSTMYLRLDSHLRSLQSLNLTRADPATWIFPLVESSLTEETLRTWQRSPFSKRDGAKETPPKNKLDILMEFLKTEVQNEQQISLAKEGFQDSKQVDNRRGGSKKVKDKVDEETPSTAAGLFNGQSSGCVFCGKPHESKDCSSSSHMSLEDKKQQLIEKKACFYCLNVGHISKKCKKFVQCLLCRKRHYTIMCKLLSTCSEAKKKEDVVEGKDKYVNSAPSTQLSNIACSGDIILKTIVVQVYSKDKSRAKSVRLLFDDGCQRSFITTHAANMIRSNPVGQEKGRSVLFDGSVTEFQMTNLHEVTLESIYNNTTHSIVVREKAVLGGNIPRVPNGKWLKELQKKGITISDHKDAPVDRTEIDIVIGSEHWGRLMTGKMHRLQNGLCAIQTIFGWTLCGPTPKDLNTVGADTVSMFMAEEDVTKMWNLELIGITEDSQPKTEDEKADEAKQYFEDTVQRKDNGQYSVRLPWRNVDMRKDLSSNHGSCKQRLVSTTRDVEAKGVFEAYHSVFQQWLAEGLIEVVELSDIQGSHYFIPHHAVLKNSTTTPVRPVFDASFKKGRQPSLNDCLYKGPNCLELLPSVLMIFREKAVGVSADIRKAFQTILVQEEDRNYLLFLWWSDASKTKIIIYRHTRVVFGVNCSPYLLAGVLKLHLSKVPDESKKLAAEILRAMYVDNLLTSVDSVELYENFKSCACEILSEAQMELRQWERTLGGSFGVSSDIDLECGLKLTKEETLTNVLGMKWDKLEDTLSVDLSKMKWDLPVTMRTMLAALHRIFDPIGVTAPALITPKIIIQKGWSEKLSWDQDLPGVMQEQFIDWIKDVKLLEGIKLPRHLQAVESSGREIHCFCDASQYAYATVVFLRSGVPGKIKVNLVMAKSRLTPPQKNITIPRMELLACVIGAKLTAHVKTALKYEDVPTYYWSDSTTALSWIKRNDEWGTYVGNRVRSIMNTTKTEEWNHVPGSHNPADLPSRGCTVLQLVESKWWLGPTWLYQERGRWPGEKYVVCEEDISRERKRTTASMFTTEVEVWYKPKFSSYTKNVRVFAWIHRWISNVRLVHSDRNKLSWLTMKEVRQAESSVLKLIQEESFTNRDFGKLPVKRFDDGLLRVRSSIVNRDDKEEFKWPVLLPRKNAIVESMIMEAHKMFCHGGVQFLMGKLREKYWILQSRRSISSVIHKCVICKRFNEKKLEVEPAVLPKKRVTSGEVFETTGVDLAGPLFLKDGRKVWVVLYTCAVYRCLHLDTVMSLDTPAFLDTLERFIYQYGRPSTIYSDNGTNFVGANNLFKRIDWGQVEGVARIRKIMWIFSPPTAAWYGGWWERLVRSVKDLLRRMLGKAKLTHGELRTCLAAVAWTINERPLTTVSEDPEDLEPLTPAHFMRGTRCAEFPEAVEIDALALKKQNRKMIKVKAALQARFRREYLANLVNWTPQKKPHELKTGHVVLVGDFNRKRFEWLLGKIVKLIPGRDEKVRVAEVRTKHGVLTRPIQRLYSLEMSDPEDVPVSGIDIQVETTKEPEETVELIKTRGGRIIKKPTRYGNWRK